MLHLIPAPLHRQLYRIADKTRRRWWRVRKPDRTSVLIAAFDERGRVLLVRHSYGPPVWALPGGGIGRDEDPALGAAREFREELRCELVNLVEVEAKVREDSGSHDLLYLFAAELAGAPTPDMREIVAAQLFEPADLPRTCDRRVGLAVARAFAALSKQR
jgi:ADP-ribose pyrophosphatase YjhB (NUDIX family)